MTALRKLQDRTVTDDPAAPFIDRAGYLDYIDRAEKKDRALLAEHP